MSSPLIRAIRIIKKPLSAPLEDIPINFPPLKDLYLNLMEIPEKLKKGLPLIPPPKPNLEKRKAEDSSKIKNKEKEDVLEIETKTHKNKKDKKEKKKERKKEKKKLSNSKSENHTHTDSSDHSKSRKNDKHKEKNQKKEEIEHEINKRKKEIENKYQKSGKKPSRKIVLSSSEDDNELLDEIGEDDEENETNEETEDNTEENDEEENNEEEEEDDEYAGLTPEEKLAKQKEEMLFRFRILKKRYGKTGTVPIPEWNEHTDLHTMKSSYDRTLKELYLDDTVETYRTYLMGSWVALEYFCVQVMGIDIKGFSLQQINSMHKYDRLLIELGEKSYSKWNMDLPVEVRLIGLVLFQAAIFYLGKVVYENYGPSMAELFRGFTGQSKQKENNEKNEKNGSGSEHTGENNVGTNNRGPVPGKMRGPPKVPDYLKKESPRATKGETNGGS